MLCVYVFVCMCACVCFLCVCSVCTCVCSACVSVLCVCVYVCTRGICVCSCPQNAVWSDIIGSRLGRTTMSQNPLLLCCDWWRRWRLITSPSHQPASQSTALYQHVNQSLFTAGKPFLAYLSTHLTKYLFTCNSILLHSVFR